MPINPSFVRRAVDAISQSKRSTVETPRPITSAESVLGLQFTPGDVVVDVVTGQKGTVDAGYTQATIIQPARPKAD